MGAPTEQQKFLHDKKSVNFEEKQKKNQAQNPRMGKALEEKNLKKRINLESPETTTNANSTKKKDTAKDHKPEEELNKKEKGKSDGTNSQSRIIG